MLKKHLMRFQKDFPLNRWHLIFLIFLTIFVGLLLTLGVRKWIYSVEMDRKTMMIVQAYNAGPTVLKKYNYKRVPIWETVKYVKKVDLALNNPKLATKYDDQVEFLAAKYSLKPQLVKAVIHAESLSKHNALSKAGARGLMQVMEPTWNDMTKKIKKNWPYEDAFVPEKNIEIGCAYLRWLDKLYEKKLRELQAKPEKIQSWNNHSHSLKKV